MTGVSTYPDAVQIYF